MSNSCEMMLSVGADPASFKHVSEKKKTKKDHMNLSIIYEFTWKKHNPI